MRPGDTWTTSFALTGAPTGTPTAALCKNGVADGAVTPTVTAVGGGTNNYIVSAVIPSSGYLAGDTIEYRVTATVSGETQTAPQARETIDADDPVSIANTVLAAFQATAIPVDVAKVGGSTIAAGNFHDDLLATPVTVDEIAAASATATAVTVGRLDLNKGVMVGSPSPTDTTFSATVNGSDGTPVTTGSGGFNGMVIVPQGDLNYKRTIISHAIVGSRHDFVIDSTNPWPTGFAVAGMTFILG